MNVIEYRTVERWMYFGLGSTQSLDIANPDKWRATVTTAHAVGFDGVHLAIPSTPERRGPLADQFVNPGPLPNWGVVAAVTPYAGFL